MAKKMEKNTLDLLKRAHKAFNQRDVHELREISGKSIIKLAIDRKKTHLLLAMISYILAKIIAKPRYEKAAPEFFKKVEANFKKAIAAAEKAKEKQVVAALNNILKNLEDLEKVDRRFVFTIVDKAKLKVAAILYAQGLSLDMAIEITGADRNELLKFTGGTMMADRVGKTLSAKERLKYARKILK